jgi:large subunit ribosomal protein L7/L12
MYDVILLNCGCDKLMVTEELADIAGAGMKKSHELMASLPTIVLKNVSEYDAQDAKERLEALGARVQIKHTS